jgi:3-hydroxyisobutyrate dehydrogenase-like beta-hydroxyacid dehydrogenase
MTDASRNIAFIGIGKMGLPMSALDAKAGYAVTAFDQSNARLAAAREQGISIAGSPIEAVDSRAVVITSLPDDAAPARRVAWPEEPLGAMTPGAVLIETSTVSAEASSEVDAAASARGIAYLRAPLSGNASIVHTGALTCFVSGPEDAFESARPLLRTLGDKCRLDGYMARIGAPHARRTDNTDNNVVEPPKVHSAGP